MKNANQLFHVLVAGSGALALMSSGCGGEDTAGKKQPSVSTGGGGGESGSGGTSGSSGGSGGSTASGGSGGAEAAGGSGGSVDCEQTCSTAANGWVYCDGSCCWLGSTHPCCH